MKFTATIFNGRNINPDGFCHEERRKCIHILGIFQHLMAVSPKFSSIYLSGGKSTETRTTNIITVATSLMLICNKHRNNVNGIVFSIKNKHAQVTFAFFHWQMIYEKDKFLMARVTKY